MTPEKREEVISNIADMLRVTSFTFEFVVKEKPEGIKIICEVTQENMEAIVKRMLSNKKGKK